MINAIHFYRIERWLYLNKVPFLPILIKGLIFLIYNSSIPYQCTIGKGTRFSYGGISVVIHKDAIIGKKCIIGSCVTLGGKSGFKKVPIVGDNVNISTGSKLLGEIIIGNNVIIGANAVVIKNVPDNVVVAGVPAKIIKKL